VFENAAHTEARDTMAGAAVDRRDGMSAWWASRRDAMAGIAAEVGDDGSGVVGVGSGKARRVVAGAALGVRVVREIRINRPHGDSLVVAAGALAQNARVIVAAIRIQFQKMVRVMAIIAFGAGFGVIDRFADRGHAVVAFAAVAEDQLMIDVVDGRKSERSMTGLAQVGGRDMRRRFVSRVGPVVATVATLTRNQGIVVVDECVGEAPRVVAGTTILRRRQVNVRFGETDDAVVASGAGILIQVDLRMVESAGGEIVRCMAGGAILGRRQVPHRRRRLAGSEHAVVAAVAAHADHLGIAMVDLRAEKALGIMAGAALADCRHVDFGFAGADDIVVAGSAAILVEVSRAVRKGACSETARRMANRAILRRFEVTQRGYARG